MKKLFQISSYFLLTTLLLISVTSCDDNGDSGEKIYPTTGGVFILNEGQSTKNNASLTYYNPINGDYISDVFKGRLGETAQDIIIYGNKIYIAVFGSNIITVIDKTSLNQLSSIALKTDNQSAQAPRYFETSDGNLYVTCYSGHVARIDTAELKVNAITEVGRNPEGIAAYNGKLYVANSGGQNPTNTLSIIDMESFQEEEKIEVGLNPFTVKSDGSGNLYLTYQGNFNGIPGGFQRIDTKTKNVYDVAEAPKQKFEILNNQIYYYDVTWLPPTYEQVIDYGIFDIASQTTLDKSFIDDESFNINSPYGLNINPATNEIYLLDAYDYVNRGEIYIFNSDGIKIGQKTVGVSPNKVVFY